VGVVGVLRTVHGPVVQVTSHRRRCAHVCGRASRVPFSGSANRADVVPCAGSCRRPASPG